MTAVASPSRPDLRVFTDPASVAVVGASDDPAKWGYWLASGALAGAHRRAVHLVNSRSATVLGRGCAASISELPETPELVALCVPAHHVDDVVDAALARGTRGFLGITAGIADDTALAARITAAGARLIGSNSLGIYDATHELRLMWGAPTPGPLAIVSQSGQLGSELVAIGRRAGIGISRFLSIGNQSDVTATELLADLADRDDTAVIALYLESFAGGQALFETLAALRASGKPTVLLTVGASNASVRLARTHTGSLTAPVDVVDAACRAAGVVRVSTPTELIDVARGLLAASLPRGRRIAIVGDSGGQSGIAADVAAAAGLTVPQLPEALAETLAAQLPSGAACSNPVDLAGAGEQDLRNYARVVEQVGATGGVDAVVLTGYFGCYGQDTPALAGAEAAVAEKLGVAGIPVIVHSMAPDSDTAQVLWRSGVPVYGSIEAAMRVLAHLAAATATPPAEVPPCDDTTTIGAGYWAARTWLGEAGIEFPPGVLVHDDADLAAGLREPLVLKAGWLEHKSEAGGVHTHLTGLQAREALADMRARLGDGDYVLEELDRRPDAVEVLVAARRDPDLGPVVVVGAGGTETEVHRDIRMECAPVTAATATAMLEALRIAPLLRGWRGRAPVDVAALADVIVTVSRLVASHAGVDEIELNPVRATATGALAVDALVVTRCSPTGKVLS
ncbi:acetate--CoA ligase family protein [Mycolicibacterium tokaiense]|uniref:acetate--CoA ligase family protein n=1 Tax=Mycolicibacterium tokaiense TaxID=39695 RepID=UPI00138D719A|nr:acetate--CoA ligase family protein [Mycolicibacterium tokaiense]BBY90154.1 CoA-binding protein [Mycolicibacterium tokaiense]